MKRFEGKTVLITGGTSGIGLALARAFRSEGAHVATCARSAEGLHAFRGVLPDAIAVEADVTSAEDRARLLETVKDRFGKLDILVSNAGRLVERDFSADLQADESLAAEFVLNLIAPVQLVSAALDQFEGLRNVVLISSGYALAPPTRSPTYGAAKAGLHAFATALRRQLKGRGVAVTEVMPPVVDTPATTHRNVRKVSPEQVAQATLNAVAAGKSEALIGPVRMLPLLLRLAPGAAGRMVAKT